MLDTTAITARYNTAINSRAYEMMVDDNKVKLSVDDVPMFLAEVERLQEKLIDAGLVCHGCHRNQEAIKFKKLLDMAIEDLRLIALCWTCTDDATCNHMANGGSNCWKWRGDKR